MSNHLSMIVGTPSHCMAPPSPSSFFVPPPPVAPLTAASLQKAAPSPTKASGFGAIGASKLTSTPKPARMQSWLEEPENFNASEISQPNSASKNYEQFSLFRGLNSLATADSSKIVSDNDAFGTPRSRGPGTPDRRHPTPISVEACIAAESLKAAAEFAANFQNKAAAAPSPSTTTTGTSNLQSVETFTLALRKADNVVLGLDVSGSECDNCLTVQAVRPNGAVDAWNRQCAGELREIRPGDRIVQINSAADAVSMRAECLKETFLRMKIERDVSCMSTSGSSSREDSSPPPGLTRPSGLRADAHEFVPTENANGP